VRDSEIASITTEKVEIKTSVHQPASSLMKAFAKAAEKADDDEPSDK